MKKSFCVVLLILLLSLLLSFGYAALESAHDCHGEVDCPICKVIAVLSAFLGIVALPIFFYVICGSEEKRRVENERDETDVVTLVLLKVKLSD